MKDIHETMTEVDVKKINVGFVMDDWKFSYQPDGFDVERKGLDLRGHMTMEPFRLTLKRDSDGKTLIDEHFDEEPQFKVLYTMLKNVERDELDRLGTDLKTIKRQE